MISESGYGQRERGVPPAWAVVRNGASTVSRTRSRTRVREALTARPRLKPQTIVSYTTSHVAYTSACSALIRQIRAQLAYIALVTK